MKGIIILGHGSRNKDSIAEQNQVIPMIQEMLPDYTVRNAFFQLCEPKFEDILNEMIQDGFQDITVMPLLLFAGVHVQTDIPELIQEYRSQYPDISFALTKHIGAHKKIAEIAVERIVDGDIDA
ncbi:hypothetical protein BHU72_07965 [Desulfuribacillus stibiiarsenatis]|uniref:Cobalamin biosynthesis protein CbiX n=1 Tax=Desulfuribacillus stibiiarsenatis TaxID=1390249 RepID=A0A1E5L3N6_9FIRM|nr:CbiX/SirB N-terminal domain-containing protein [Desulfuribacillus stibiiarsenatis]OEH84760.1 hypothetical protein BHU72_07965 [Desulfuribacillus stibiiarsenatis]